MTTYEPQSAEYLEVQSFDLKDPTPDLSIVRGH